MNDTEQNEKLNETLHKLEFRGRMNLFYHEKRERFYNYMMNWTAFVSIIFSSVAFLLINNQFNFLGIESLDSWILGLSALLVSVANGSILAFGMVQKSHQHAAFRGKWVRFLGKVNSQKNNISTEVDLGVISRLEKQFYDITQEEPSTVSKDVDWAYNKTIEAMGLKSPKLNES